MASSDESPGLDEVYLVNWLTSTQRHLEQHKTSELHLEQAMLIRPSTCWFAPKLGNPLVPVASRGDDDKQSKSNSQIKLSSEPRGSRLRHLLFVLNPLLRSLLSLLVCSLHPPVQRYSSRSRPMQLFLLAAAHRRQLAWAGSLSRFSVSPG